jgi:hypothetical protein
MQRNTIFFIVVKALHVPGGFPAHHKELKNCTHRIWYFLSLVAATASVVEMELVGSISTTLAVAATKLNKYQMLHVLQFFSS